MKKTFRFLVSITFIFIITNQLNAQWTKISQPFYIQINCMFANKGNLFAGTWWGGGVFRSTNNGASWIDCNSGLGDIQIDALTISDSNLFAGTTKGVIRSTDNGTSWTAANSGINDRIICFAVNDTNLFAGGWGIYRSTNNGNSWKPVNTGLTNYYVRSLIANGGNLYAATWGGGIFLSINNGISWTEINSGLTTTNVNTLAVCGGNLYAGTLDGLFYSTNDGLNWEQTNVHDYIYSIAVNGEYLFAVGVTSGVNCSTDNGASWTAVNTGLTNPYVLNLCVSDTTLFVGTSGGGVFLSTNNGSSWTEANIGLKTAEVSALTQDSTNFYAGTRGGGIFLSTDGGNAWVANNLTIGNPNILSLVATPSYFFVGTQGGGAQRSSYGVFQWSTCNSGFPEILPDVTALAFINTKLFAGTPAGIYCSTNWGDSWTSINSGLPDNSYINALTVRDNNLFAAINGQGIYISPNDGSSWTPFDSNSISTNAKALAVSDTNLFAGNDNGVSLSSTIRTDKGWTQVNSGLTDNKVWSLNVKTASLIAGTIGGIWRRPLREMIAVAPKLTTSGLAFGNVLIGQFKESTIRISNGGTDTLKITKIVSLISGFSARPTMLNIPPGQSHRDTLRYTPVEAGGTSGKIVIYSNAASSPDTIAVSGYGIRAALLQLNTVRVFFRNVKVGQFRDTTITITNNGNDTLKISNIQSTNSVFSTRTTTINIIQGQSFTDTLRFTPITTDMTSGYIYIYSNATPSLDTIKLNGNGIITDIGNLPDQIPREYSLSQNYPNPFNPSTKISYQIPKTSFVNIKVYNILGKEIATLVNEEEVTGNYSVEFNAKSLPSGIYYYQLKADNYRQTKKMILLR